MTVTRRRTMRRLLMAAATAALCVAVMGVAAATRDRAPGMDDAVQAAPHAVLPGVGALEGSAIREEAGMLVAGMILIGAAAAVRRAA